MQSAEILCRSNRSSDIYNIDTILNDDIKKVSKMISSFTSTACNISLCTHDEYATLNVM